MNPWNVKKHTSKIVLVSSAPAGNGTVTVAKLKYSDTEYYQVNAAGDYVQG